MLRRALSSFPVALVVACSSSSSPPPAAASRDLTFDSGPYVVPAGESFECFYTSVVTDADMSVTGATASQGPGGHHVTVYYTDQTQPVGHHPCVDAEMISWHQVGADSGNKEGVVALPAGYATRVPAGKQIVVQSHYVNTTGAAETARDVVAVHTIDPSQVKAYANSFVMADSSFTLPPRCATTSVSECVVPKDLSVILLLGHMHEQGTHYRLEALGDAGAPSTVLYDTDWTDAYVSHPPVNRYDPSSPLALRAGTRLRQTCSWDNTSGDAMQFPSEMCVLFTYYVPDAGWINCDVHEVTP